MKITNRLLVCAYLVVAAFPAIARVAHLRDRDLAGALPPVKRPHLTLRSVLGDTFQPAFATWFERSLGYRNYAVAIDSTIMFHAFDAAKLGGHVIVGDRNVLFERDDINLANAPVPPAPELADRLADKLALLQHRMQQNGRAFIPIIVPSKTTVYRDSLPPRWHLYDAPFPSDEVYRMTKRALDRRGILYVDALEMLTTSREPRDLLWGPQARHWSDYGACLAVEHVVATFRTLTGRALELTCRYTVGRRPRTHDNYDLLRLLNAWMVPRNQRDAIVTIDPPESTVAPSLKILFISSSFGWQALRQALASERFGEVWLDYYDSSVHGFPSGYLATDLAVGSSKWNEIFLDEDIYVYELFETYLYAGNLEHALDKLLANLPAQRPVSGWQP